MNSPYFGMNRAYFGEIQGGSRNSGFIQRMLAERPEDFEINAIENPSAYLRARFSKPIASAPAPSEPPRRKRTIIRLGKPNDVANIAKQNKIRKDRQDTEERFIEPYMRTIANIKYYSQTENWKNLTTKDKASLNEKIYRLDYYQKQVPEVGANPYPNADSLPSIEMRRAYKLWLKKNNLSDK